MFFTSRKIGNGTDHRNINLLNLSGYNLDWDTKEFSGVSCMLGVNFIHVNGTKGSEEVKVVLPDCLIM